MALSCTVAEIKRKFFIPPSTNSPGKNGCDYFCAKIVATVFFPGEFVEGGMKNVRFISATVQDRVMVIMLDE